MARAYRVLLSEDPIAHLQESLDKWTLAFDRDYVESAPRPVLGQTFEDRDLRHPRRTRGLPNAPIDVGRAIDDRIMAPSEPKSIFRFSLAGVQPKLSVHLDDDLRATVPLSGAGGRWIAKLPSRQHPGLTRVELAVMRWAAASGFEVPETALIPLADISGVPSAFATVDEPVFLCRRCDRTDERRLHQEDLAQVCDVPPGAKYGESGIDLVRLSRVMQRVLGDEGHVLFLRRLVFDLACGNGDAHLKNWSLLYRVPHRPSLAPCYDLVATILYLPDDRPALHYPGKPGFRQVDTPCFRKLLRQTGSDTEDIWTALRQTLEAIRDAWSAHRPELSLTDDEAARIEAHMDAVPLLRELAGPRRS